MKQLAGIALVCAAMISLSACSSRKQYAGSEVQYDDRDCARLSKQFGLRLGQLDNLRLYDASGRWLGTPYRYGGNSKKGVDCSGLILILYRQVYGVSTERTASGIFRKNCTPVKRENLREGDLVFFKTSQSGGNNTPSHVGIYLKNGKFIHASMSRGVIVSSLSEPYYVRAWIAGGRVLARRRK